ncbi:DMT family transporter [Pseudoalteromonas denitrificans]|uniref:EamA domain-containing membrane protein RarD n=1 Tax=Pseudoalteromonas denitrificans DSM 6059 TaxID=1123010 RepID=A0A1I1MFL6_9GAMM|nr:EamA family transporter [Pseudoalteromonas denitrificans]SFC81868.1 EamA domain-containing membrane protein RarD [Pseudoalteromonas denitrificans DSM 6059]
MNSQSSLSFIFLAIISAICMGTIGVLAKFAVFPAEHITFYRLFLGAICLLLYMLSTEKKSQILHKPSKRTITNGIMLASFMVCYIQAMSYTSMANAVMLIYLAPLLCAVIAHFIFSEKLTIFNLFTIALALIGFAMMMQFSLSIPGSKNESLGILYGVLSLFSYSAFMLINRKPSNSTPYQSTLVQLLSGALCMLPFLILSPETPSITQSFWLLAIGIIPGFIAILCAVKALRNLPSVTFGTVAYIEPVAVVCFAWWLFDETLNFMQLIGCCLIIGAGIVQGILSQKRVVG